MTTQNEHGRSLPYPCNKDRAKWARAALVAYQRTTGFIDEPLEVVLRYLIADLGHLASMKDVDFTPILARAQSYWIEETLQANERPPPTD